jgi:hypothetical protein
MKSKIKKMKKEVNDYKENTKELMYKNLKNKKRRKKKKFFKILKI